MLSSPEARAQARPAFPHTYTLTAKKSYLGEKNYRPYNMLELPRVSTWSASNFNIVRTSGWVIVEVRAGQPRKLAPGKARLDPSARSDCAEQSNRYNLNHGEARIETFLLTEIRGDYM
jgi:hypothetical protein